VIAATIGLAIYVLTFGPGHMFGTSAYWDMPDHDPRTHLIGYRYFLQEPWHWPLFATRTMNVPYRESIAFTDSIPLWALINKVIATVIPPWGKLTIRAYLGIWHALVYALQACAGVAILRQLGHRSRGAAIVTSLFFVAIPAWVMRYSHASLEAHFLTLTAFYLYLRMPEREPASRRLQLAWLTLLAAAALINPYHTVMCFGLFVAGQLRSRQPRELATWLPLGALAIGGAASLAGYFSSEASAHMPGFDAGSTNMLSMIVPMKSKLLGDATWLANVQATEFQYEGWAYLGLGLLILLGCALTRIRSLPDVIRAHRVLFGLVVMTWLLALSNHVYFGSHLVLEYPIPEALHWIPDQFRAPGRFVWLPMYAVVIIVLHAGFSMFASGRKLLVLPLLALLQVVDTRGAWDWPLQNTDSGRKDDELGVDSWRPLVLAHDAVYVLPSYDCVHDKALENVSLELEFLASERALPLNGVYSSRPVRDCDADQLSLGALPLQPNTLYVLLSSASRITKHLQGLGAICAVFSHGLACSSNKEAITKAISSGALSSSLPSPAVLVAGQHLHFNEASTQPYLLDGWSYAEPSGRWTDGPEAAFHFRFQSTTAPHALKLRAAAAICGMRIEEDVDVLVQGARIGVLHFDARSNDPGSTREIAISRPEMLADDDVLVELWPHDPRPPSQIGCNSDTRELAISVSELWLE
jgi:hypothetical protein